MPVLVLILVAFFSKQTSKLGAKVALANTHAIRNYQSRIYANQLSIYV